MLRKNNDVHMLNKRGNEKVFIECVYSKYPNPKKKIYKPPICANKIKIFSNFLRNYIKNKKTPHLENSEEKEEFIDYLYYMLQKSEANLESIIKRLIKVITKK